MSIWRSMSGKKRHSSSGGSIAGPVQTPLFRIVEPEFLRASALDPGTHLPKLLGTFAPGEANIVGVNVIREIPNKGLSLFSRESLYHMPANTVTSETDITASGQYSVLISKASDTLVTDLFSGMYRNPMLTPTVRTGGKQKQLNVKCFVCYELCSTVPTHYRISCDNHWLHESDSGHHLLCPIGDVACITVDKFPPSRLPHAVCQDIIELSWVPHCIKMIAQAEPEDYMPHFDHHVWRIAVLLFHNANNIYCEFTDELLLAWERNSYHYSADDREFPVPHDAVIGTVQSLEAILGGVPDALRDVKRFLVRFAQPRTDHLFQPVNEA
jgi:hypothetical protein